MCLKLCLIVCSIAKKRLVNGNRERERERDRERERIFFNLYELYEFIDIEL